MFPLQFDIVYFCKFFAFYTFWFIIHQILAKNKILNKSNALKILIFSVLQKYIWTRNICTAISALIPFLFGTAASTIIPKQSNCVCEKPQTDFAGNTGCPLLKSPANGSRFSCNSMSKSLDEQAFYMLCYTIPYSHSRVHNWISEMKHRQPPKEIAAVPLLLLSLPAERKRQTLKVSE